MSHRLHGSMAHVQKYWKQEERKKCNWRGNMEGYIEANKSHNIIVLQCIRIQSFTVISTNLINPVSIPYMLVRKLVLNFSNIFSNNFRTNLYIVPQTQPCPHILYNNMWQYWIPIIWSLVGYYKYSYFAYCKATYFGEEFKFANSHFFPPREN